MAVSVPIATHWIRNRGDEPSLPVVNRFFEQNPTNTKDGSALIERPALVKFSSAGNGPGRRLFRQAGFANGDLFHVSGGGLYRHSFNTLTRIATVTQIPGVIQGTGAPEMCSDQTHLFITDGYSLQYTDGVAALATVDTTGIGGVAFSSIDIFDRYVMCAVGNSDRFYWLQPGATTFNNLDFATAERFPDKIVQVRAVGDTLWLMGEKSVEVWRATGDGTAPFQRIEGIAWNFGIFGGTAVRMKDTSVVVVGDDGTVWNITGTPTIISTPAIAEATRDAILKYLGG